MSKITRVKCNQCDKEVKDPTEHPGWIQVLYERARGLMTVTVPVIRLIIDTKDTEKRIVELKKNLDFCCVDCLVKYLKKKFKEAK